MKHIILNYPSAVRVGDLPVEEDENKTELCYALFNQGLLLIDN